MLYNWVIEQFLVLYIRGPKRWRERWGKRCNDHSEVSVSLSDQSAVSVSLSVQSAVSVSLSDHSVVSVSYHQHLIMWKVDFLNSISCSKITLMFAFFVAFDFTMLNLAIKIM